MHYRLLIVIVITIFSCKKALDINDFSDDFGHYESELRIEALILPADNSAIIRIDRSARLDEGLNDEGYYNCIDDDNDWNYYYCAPKDTSYEEKGQCESDCNSLGSECILHFYLCDSDSTTFIDKVNCVQYCNDGECVTDDLGKDGIPSFPPDKGEGDGQFTCGEPNIDEFDEVLPGIHVDNCQVYITQATDTCFFEYKDDGGSFFEDVKRGDELFDAELVRYGAWLPKTNACNLQFNQYDSLYSLFCDCSNESGFESYTQITATDNLVRPVVYYHEYMEDSLLKCISFEDKETIYNCMEPFNITDTLFIDLGNINYDSIDCTIFQLAANMLEIEIDPICENIDFELKHDILLQYIALSKHSSVEELFVPKIRYASLFETNYFQAVQYIYNRGKDQWVYSHGHPDAVTSTENNINNKIVIWFEALVAEPYRNKDYKVESSQFRYDIFTFSKGYENYYFYDALDLNDPVRTNLRDQNNNPVMGGFGSMARNSIYFEIISVDSLLSQ